ncbi:hypothetical protein [Kitasatospora sp. NPDC051914]|uniref:hypothetical protein n=1 Tax=Kitasatospora sp. NPDC051914 TaxID=3154945 RepID=UPI00341AB3FE
MSHDEDEQQQPDRPDQTDRPPAAKTRTAFVRAKAYPNGSTGPLRHSVLEVLGVLKVATVKQTWLLAQPGHEKPNTVAGALRDLALNKLTEKRGTTSGIPAPSHRPPTVTRPPPTGPAPGPGHCARRGAGRCGRSGRGR